MANNGVIWTLLICLLAQTGANTLGQDGDPAGAAPADAAPAPEPAPPVDPAQSPVAAAAAADPPAPPPAPAPAAQLEAGSIRFTFKDAPIEVVLDFFAREAALPVIREADPPGDWKITFISAESYDLTGALSVLNTILQTRGFVMQRDERFLYFRTLDGSARRAPLLAPGEEGTVTPEQVVTVVVPLNNAIAKDLAEQLKPLVAAFGQALPLPTQNAIIITEAAQQVEQLRRIIEQLDERPAYEESVRIFPLEHITPDEAITSLKALVAEKQTTIIIDGQGQRRVVEDETTPGIRLEPNASTNSVIALGPEGRLKTIEQIIKLIDVPGGGTAADGRQMATFSLSTLGSAEAQQVLESLFRGMPEDKRPTVVPLAAANKVTVIGSAVAVVQAGALLGEMDSVEVSIATEGARPAGASIESQTLVHPLAHAGADQVIASAGELMTPRQKSAVRLAPAPGGRGVIVVGSPGDVASVVSLISAIDGPGASDLDARIVHLSGATTRAAVDRAQQLFAATAAGPADSVRIELDDQAGIATLIGPGDSLDRFIGLLRTAESAVCVERESRIYAIDRPLPSELAGSLARLARPMLAPADGSPYVEPSFEAADEVGRLVVRASPDQFAVIESLVEALRGDGSGATRFRVVRVVADDPGAVARRAAQLFDQLGAPMAPAEAGHASWELDPGTGSVLVTGDEAGVARFAALLDEAQRLMPPARTSELIELEFTEAAAVIEPLKRLVAATPFEDPGRSIAPPDIQVAPAGNGLLLTGEPAQLAIAREHLLRLDVLEPTDLPPLRLLTVRSADVNAVAEMLRDQYAKRSIEDRRLNPVDFRAEPSTNTLIVSARDADFAEVKSFVDGLNMPEGEAERATEIFQLKVAKAADVASALQLLFPDPPMPVDRRGAPLPHLKQPREVNISADPNSNTLIIDAPAERIADFQALVDKLDRVELPERAILRTYRIERADVNAVAATLNALARAGTLAGAAQAGKPAVPVTIEAEPVSGTLIVAGDETAHEQVRVVLEDLSAAPVERGLRVVRLAGADPAEVAERARTIYGQQVEGIPGAGPVDVTVSADTNSLMIVADDESMARFLGILDELERQAGPPRELRLIELQHIPAAEAVGFLADLVQSTRPFVRSGGIDPVFEPIEQNNALMVAAQADQHAIIEALVRSIDVPTDARTEPLRILRLRSAEAANIAGVLTQAFAGRTAEERASRPVTIRADEVTNTLIVSAHPEVMPEIERIVSDLNDAQSYDAEGREIRIFPLKVARAEELAKTIDQMYPEPPVPVDPRGRPLPHLQQPREVVVRADAQTNALIVDAPARRMSGFEQLVEQLDRAEIAGESVLRTYRLANADVGAVVATVRKLADSGGLDLGDAGPRLAQVVVEGEPLTGTVVVSAPPSAIAQIDSVIAELDGTMADVETEIAFFRLTTARADRVAPIMEKLLASRLAEQAQKSGARPQDAAALLEVVADRATNSLIVTAPAALVPVAREIVGQLDTGGQAAGRDVVRVVPLALADPAQTAQALQQTVAGIDLPSGGAVSITAATGSSALVVSGAELDVEYIAGLVKELDASPADQSVGVQTIYLRHARAETIAPIVEELLAGERLDEWMRFELRRRGQDEGRKEVRVAAEPRLNAVVITAPREVLAVAAEVVAQLDAPREAADRPLKILTLANADAAEVAASLEAVLAGDDGEAPPVVRVDASSNSLLVRATPAQLEALEHAVKSLDNATVAGTRQMRTVPIDRSRTDAATLALTLQRLLEQQGGVKVEVISSEELLERNRGGSGEPPAGATDLGPASVAPVFDDSAEIEVARRRILVPKRMRLIIGYHGTALAQAAPRAAASGDEENDDNDVTIAIDPVTNSLILLGSSRATDRVAELATLLQHQLPAEPGRIRIVELPAGVDAEHVQRLVDGTIAQLGRSGLDNPGGLTGAVSVVADPVGDALIVAANDTDFATISALIAAVAAPSAADEVTVKIYPLSTISGWRAAQAVNDFVSASPSGRQARRIRGDQPLVVTLTAPDGTTRQAELDAGSVRAMAGPNDESLIVAAPSQAIAVIDNFLGMLDQSELAGEQLIREYALEHGSAADITRTLQGVFDAARVTRGTDRGVRAQFVADDRTNTLLVTASALQHGEVQRLLATLDAKMADDGRPLELIRLQSAQAGAVARTVQDVIVGNDPARRDTITITGDDALGILFVRAPEEELEQIRSLVSTVDAPESDQLPVRTIALASADAQQVAGQLQRFLDDRARASTTPGQREKSRRVSITGDRRSGVLIVAAGDEDFEQISALAKSLDNAEEFGELEFRTMQLKHARAADLWRTLTSLRDELQWIESRRNWQGAEDPDAGVVTLESDNRTNSIILIGRGKALETMARVVESLDRPQPDAAALTVKVFKVQRANLSIVRTAVEQAVGGQARSDDWWWWEPPDPSEVTVEADEANRSIIVIGPEAKLAGVGDIIAQIESAVGEAAALAVETIPLQHAEAERAAGSVSRFFEDRARLAGSDRSPVSIIGSRDGNALIVTAPADEMPLARDIIAKIDTSDLAGDRAVEIVALKFAKATEVAGSIGDLFGARSGPAERRIVASPDARTNSLVIAGPGDVLPEILALVERLDSQGQGEVVKLQTFSLATARADEIARTLREALDLNRPASQGAAALQDQVRKFTNEAGDPVEVKAGITADRRSNTLLVSADDESMAIIAELIAELDDQPSVSPLVYKIIPLKHALAVDAALDLRTLVRNMPADAGSPSPSITSSDRDNTIIIAATADQLTEIESLLAQLDTPTGESRTTEFVPLRFADAEKVQEALRVFYGKFSYEAQTPAERNVSIVADPSTNSLVISADEAVWPGIRELLTKLDAQEYDTANQLEVIALQHADARSVAQALQQTFDAPLRAELERERQAQREAARERGGERLADLLAAPSVLVNTDQVVSVSAETMTNSLIVSAGRKDMDKIKAIVKTIDVPDFARLPAPVILPIRSGKASALASTLRQMYEYAGGAGSQNRSVRSVSIVGDDESGTLIVRAEEAELAQIKALAETLQQEGELTRVSVRVLALHRQPASRLAGTILRTFGSAAEERNERLAVETDRQSNTLVIASSAEMFEEIQALVREVDGPAPGDPGAVPAGLPSQGLFIIDVQHLSPAEVREQLEALGVTQPVSDDRPGVVSEPVIIVPLATRSSIAVLAAPVDGPIITSLVRALDAEPAGAEQEVSIVRLSIASASGVAETLRRMIDTSATDATTGLSAALAEQVRRLHMAGAAIDENDLAIDLTKPVRIQPDDQTNAIVITSTPSNVVALRQLAEMLDRLPEGDAVVVRIFHLDSASAERIAQIVRDLFSQGEALRRAPGTQLRGMPTTETGRALAGEIAVSVDDRTNALIIAGREEAVALAEILIGQLDSDTAANWLEQRLVPLKFADSVRLAETLRAILVDGIATTPEAQALQRQVGRLRVVRQDGELAPDSLRESQIFAPMTQLTIIPEEQLNALIVVGSAANVDVVNELVRQLDVEGASRADLVRVYPLQHAAADRVASMLQELFRQQVQASSLREEDSLVIQADTRTNSLVISTSARSFTIVDSLLRTLDAEDAGVSTIGLHVIPAGENDAATLGPKLEQLMRDRLAALERGGAASRDVVSIQADEATNSLIVAASKENLQVITELMTLLAEGDASGGQGIEVFTLQSAGAEEMVDLLNELYVDEVRRTRGEAALRVRADDRLNAVVVHGSQADIARIRDLIGQLDATSLMAVREIKVFPLKSANAIEVVNLLQNILSGQSIAGRGTTSRQATILRFVRSRAEAEGATETEVSAAIREQVTLTPDVRTNSVVVSAPPAMNIMIGALIDEFESSSGGMRKIEVFHLKNADAENMRAILQDLFNLQQQGQVYVLAPAGVQPADPAEEDLTPPTFALGDTAVTVVPDERQQLAITVDSRTNTLLVSGTEEYLDLVRGVVEDLDEREGVQRVQFAMELKNARIEDVAPALQSFIDQEQDRIAQLLGPDRSGSVLRQLESEVSVVGVPGTSRLIVSTSPRYEDTLRGLIEELDRAPAQVKIRVLLAEVTLDSEDSWGLDFEVKPLGTNNYTGLYRAAGTGVATAIGVPNFSVASDDFELLIRALQVQGRLEVLSRPEVTVNDNEPAEINVGEEIQIVTGVTTLNDGRLQSTVEPRNVGVILNVTPSISPDGFVRLDIAPEISALTQRTTQISEDFEAPVISQRRAETTVTVRDGQTIVIGGLIQTQNDTRKSKVPLLGDIPGVGLIFRTERTSSVRTELLIILTPQVIIDDHDMHGNTTDDITIDALDDLSDPENIYEMLPDGLRDRVRRGPFPLPPAERIDGPDLSDPDRRAAEPMKPERLNPDDADGW